MIWPFTVFQKYMDTKFMGVNHDNNEISVHFVYAIPKFMHDFQWDDIKKKFHSQENQAQMMAKMMAWLDG